MCLSLDQNLEVVGRDGEHHPAVSLPEMIRDDALAVAIKFVGREVGPHPKATGAIGDELDHAESGALLGSASEGTHKLDDFLLGEVFGTIVGQLADQILKIFYLQTERLGKLTDEMIG